jgi:hypothetical protein
LDLSELKQLLSIGPTANYQQTKKDEKGMTPGWRLPWSSAWGYVRWERRLDLHDALVSLACGLICWRRFKKR